MRHELPHVCGHLRNVHDRRRANVLRASVSRSRLWVRAGRCMAVGVVAGVDSSTQSCTVVLYDEDTGERIGLASAPHPATSPPVSEQDPRAWWQAFRRAFSRACEQAQCSPGAIVAISIAAQHHGLVALDASFRVLRPAKLWNDTTSAPQAKSLVRRLGAERWLRRAGSVPTAAFTVTKLAWLAEHEPANFANLKMAMLPHDWLTMQLTGNACTDRADASGTGYFDPVENTWCEDLLAAVDPHRDWLRQLPVVLGPQEAAGQAETESAAELGLARHALVGPGTGDQSAAALGLGIQIGDVLVSFGTGGVVTTFSARQVLDPLGVVNGTASATGDFQPVVITLNAAKVTDTFARLLGVDHDELARLALSADRLVIDRPLLLPYLDGERTPDRPFARGVLAGLSTAVTREQLALSAMEGVVLGVLDGRQELARAGVEMSNQLIVTGGAARSSAYRQVLASVSGQSVLAPLGEDTAAISARGAAIQAIAVYSQTSVRDVAAEWMPRRSVVAEPQADDADYAARLTHRYHLLQASTVALDGPA